MQQSRFGSVATRHGLSSTPVIEPLENRRLMAANLLINGNFNHGATGFATGYARGGNSLLSAGTYVVGTDPQKYHWAGANFGDHTTGTGKMLMVNGSPFAGEAIWRETVKVVPGVTYEFDGWAASWATLGPDNGDVSPAVVQLAIDGKLFSSVTLPAADGQWTSLTQTWLATAGHATITLTDLNTDVSGNDSAYDDLSFSPLATIRGTVVSKAVSPTGRVARRNTPLAGVTVYLDVNNDGILDPGEPAVITSATGAYAFTGLTPGTYQVRQENPPASALPPALLSIKLTAGKQVSHENLWDMLTITAATSETVETI